MTCFVNIFNPFIPLIMLKTLRFKSSVVFGTNALLDYGTIIREGITGNKILL